MNRIAAVLLAALFTTGCGLFSKDVGEAARPSPTPITQRPADQPVPLPVAKLLPADQINAGNAKDQARAMEEMLRREQGQATGSAANR